MLEFEVAQARLIECARQARTALPEPETESCPIYRAVGRVLAQPLIAARDLPPADNSAMDGYAVRVVDCNAQRRLPVQQRCYAGDVPQPLRSGQAIRVFTGSLIPPGADAVVMQEDCEENEEGVLVRQLPAHGQHIRRQGEDVRAGTVLVDAGVRLATAHVGMLAAQGFSEVPVWRRLRVGVLTTGDELIAPGVPATPEKIYDSNRPMLCSLVEQMGATVHASLHAPDDDEALQCAIRQLVASCELVLTVGGVSVGERDRVKPVLESLGGELDLWKVRMKPGKPVALGRVGPVPVVCLPGNPVSAYAVFTVLVSPVIRVLQRRCTVLPAAVSATLRANRKYSGSRDDFLRVQARVTDDGRLEVHPFRAQSSGIMSSLPWADGLARLRAGAEYADGDRVTYYPFSCWLA